MSSREIIRNAVPKFQTADRDIDSMSKWAFSAFVGRAECDQNFKGDGRREREREASPSKDTKDPRTADV